MPSEKKSYYIDLTNLKDGDTVECPEHDFTFEKKGNTIIAIPKKTCKLIAQSK